MDTNQDKRDSKFTSENKPLGKSSQNKSKFVAKSILSTSEKLSEKLGGQQDLSFIGQSLWSPLQSNPVHSWDANRVASLNLIQREVTILSLEGGVESREGLFPDNWSLDCGLLSNVSKGSFSVWKRRLGDEIASFL